MRERHNMRQRQIDRERLTNTQYRKEQRGKGELIYPSAARVSCVKCQVGMSGNGNEALFPFTTRQYWNVGRDVEEKVKGSK